jgi:hypothetical protein
MTYREIWPDVADPGVRVEHVRWKKPKAWGGGAMRFRRPAAVLAAVDENAHGRLLALSRRVAAAEDAVVASVQALADETWATREELKETAKGDWPGNWVAAHTMRAVHNGMREAGDEPEGDAWVAIDRAAARLLGRLQEQGRRPALPPGTKWPRQPYFRPARHAVTLRLRAGAMAGLPVLRFGPGVDTDSWLHVPGLGLCHVAECPPDVGLCAYVEAALLRQSWWLRFVFVEEAS